MDLDDEEEAHLKRVLALIAEIDRMTDDPIVLDMVVERKKRQAARRLGLPQ